MFNLWVCKVDQIGGKVIRLSKAAKVEGKVDTLDMLEVG